MLYDITRRKTFDHITSWLQECRSNGNSQMTIFLVGNKADLENQRQVTYDEGFNFAQSNGLYFLETSAKEGNNIVEAFQTMAEQIFEKTEKDIIDINNNSCGVRPVSVGYDTTL